MNQQRFGRNTDGFFVVEWLEKNYAQFYKVATFIWRSNEIQGHEMREHQDAFVTHVFEFTYKDEFCQNLSHL